MKTSSTFKNMIRDINSDWFETRPRDLAIKEVMNYSTDIKDALNLSFDLNWRKFSWKYLAAELLWYLSWSLESNDIGKYASLWNKISEDWKVNSNYWYITMNRNIDDYWNQYNFVIEKLKEDKDTRQALIRYNADEHVYKWNKDFVCTISNQFFIRDNKLNMTVNMRSNDLFYWFQYDLVWFWLLLQSIRLDLLDIYPDLELWEIHYNIGSLHIYENMYDKIDKILSSEDDIDYNIKLKKSFNEQKEDVKENEDKLREKLENWNYKDYIKDNFYIDISEK